MKIKNEIKSDYSVGAKDYPDYIINDHRYITSPSFRNMYYIMGYNDAIEGSIADNRSANHPKNQEAYDLGFKDGSGDIKPC